LRLVLRHYNDSIGDPSGWEFIVMGWVISKHGEEKGALSDRIAPCLAGGSHRLIPRLFVVWACCF